MSLSKPKSEAEAGKCCPEAEGGRFCSFCGAKRPEEVQKKLQDILAKVRGLKAEIECETRLCSLKKVFLILYHLYNHSFIIRASYISNVLYMIVNN